VAFIPPLLGDGCAPFMIAYTTLVAYINVLKGYKQPQMVDGSLAETV